MKNDDIIILPESLLAHMGWDENTQLIAIVDEDSVILRKDEDVYPENWIHT